MAPAAFPLHLVEEARSLPALQISRSAILKGSRVSAQNGPFQCIAENASETVPKTPLVGVHQTPGVVDKMPPRRPKFSEEPRTRSYADSAPG
jgi:hypothetical protein